MRELDGSVQLVAMTQPLNGMSLDSFVTNFGARVSYGATETKGKEADERLARRLILKEKAYSILEHAVFSFQLYMPHFVMDHFTRYRTASVNVQSRRYDTKPFQFWYPEEINLQSETNKQASSDLKLPENLRDRFLERTADIYESSRRLYDEMIENNVSAELARSHMPVSQMVRMSYTIDARNLMYGIALQRLSGSAQALTRLFAREMVEKSVVTHMPLYWSLFLEAHPEVVQWI